MLVISQKELSNFVKSLKPYSGRAKWTSRIISLYIFKKTIITYTNNSVEILISRRDFHCFEHMRFAHVRLLCLSNFRRNVANNHLRKARISEKRNKTNIIGTLFSSQKHTDLFMFLLLFIQNKSYKQ